MSVALIHSCSCVNKSSSYTVAECPCDYYTHDKDKTFLYATIVYSKKIQTKLCLSSSGHYAEITQPMKCKIIKQINK